MEENKVNTVHWKNGSKKELIDLLNFTLGILETLPEELDVHREIIFKSSKTEQAKAKNNTRKWINWLDMPMSPVFAMSNYGMLNEIKEGDNG